MGYIIPKYNSKDPTIPRAAIMGGAMVATLTSYRDEQVKALIAPRLEAYETLMTKPSLADGKQFRSKKN
jgi:hypothetical protein